MLFVAGARIRDFEVDDCFPREVAEYGEAAEKTDRELDVLRLLRSDLSLREIANELYLEQIEGAPLAHPRRAQLIDELTDGPRKWEEIWKLPPGEGRTRLIAKYRLPDEPPVIEVKKSDQTKVVSGVQT